MKSLSLYIKSLPNKNVNQYIYCIYAINVVFVEVLHYLSFQGKNHQQFFITGGRKQQ